MTKFVILASCLLTFSVINGQFCQFISTEAGYTCQLINANYEKQGNAFTITGGHQAGGYTDQNVTIVILATNVFPSRLVTIPAPLFTRFPNIRRLELRQAEIQFVSGLQSCQILEILDLNQNSIAVIGPEAFINCQNLREISLASNLITGINAEAFRGLSQLQALMLNNNALQSLSSGTFDLLPSIQFIALQHNQIPEVPTGTFNHLTLLQNIALYNNRITRIHTNAFQNLPGLGTIDLSNNSITDIDSLGFSGLSSLESLNLQNNSLGRLNSNSFANVPALDDLRIDNNAINAVQRGFFTNTPSLRSFNALGNLCIDRFFQIPQDQDLLAALETCFVNWEDSPEPPPETTNRMTSTTTRSTTTRHNLDCLLSNSGVAPHPTDCTKYYKCVMGIRYVKTCPEGQIFDIHSLTCGDIETSVCAH